MTDREVDEARNLAVCVERGDSLLKLTDDHHPSMHLEKIGL